MINIFSQDGSKCVCIQETSCVIWDSSSGFLLSSFSRPKGLLGGSFVGELLFIITKAGILSIDPENGEESEHCKSPSPIVCYNVDESNSKLYIACDDAKIYSVSSTPGVKPVSKINTALSEIESFAISRSHCVVASKKCVVSFNMKNQKKISELTKLPISCPILLTMGEYVLCYNNKAGVVVVIDPASSSTAPVFINTPANIVHVSCFCSDEGYCYFSLACGQVFHVYSNKHAILKKKERGKPTVDKFMKVGRIYSAEKSIDAACSLFISSEGSKAETFVETIGQHKYISVFGGSDDAEGIALLCSRGTPSRPVFDLTTAIGDVILPLKGKGKMHFIRQRQTKLVKNLEVQLKKLSSEKHKALMAQSSQHAVDNAMQEIIDKIDIKISKEKEKVLKEVANLTESHEETRKGLYEYGFGISKKEGETGMDSMIERLGDDIKEQEKGDSDLSGGVKHRLTSLIVQSLTSDNTILLESLLKYKGKVVVDTVTALPPQYCLLLLKYLSNKLQYSTHSFSSSLANQLAWIKTILLTHGAFLMTSAASRDVVADIIRYSEYHAEGMMEMRMLRGRMDFVAGISGSTSVRDEAINEIIGDGLEEQEFEEEEEEEYDEDEEGEEYDDEED
ncbi:hypothetical protein ADUPG1_011900 [Aduncisulcus paluster]|uniref:Small-subunit processome Utp12 domain-containing protein n=1 Tax=Aduncisulcus paluster TaxID=2918883 RepID=A0ABQ5JXJ9_9EUKA|nr:hypothetical protein ADUPG1_011900 [Aduncisulcus paluster]